MGWLEDKKEHIVWVSLLILTFLGFLVVETALLTKGRLALSLFGIAALKSWFILHYFMEMKTAHWIWKGFLYGGGSLLFVGLYLLS